MATVVERVQAQDLKLKLSEREGMLWLDLDAGGFACWLTVQLPESAGEAGLELARLARLFQEAANALDAAAHSREDVCPF